MDHDVSDDEGSRAASHDQQRPAAEAVSTASPQPPAQNETALGARRLVLQAIRSGSCIDHPWRHAILRNRWSCA